MPQVYPMSPRARQTPVQGVVQVQGVEHVWKFVDGQLVLEPLRVLKDVSPPPRPPSATPPPSPPAIYHPPKSASEPSQANFSTGWDLRAFYVPPPPARTPPPAAPAAPLDAASSVCLEFCHVSQL